METSRKKYKKILSELSNFDKKRIDRAKGFGARYFTFHRSPVDGRGFIGGFYKKGEEGGSGNGYLFFLEGLGEWMKSYGEGLKWDVLRNYFVEIKK